MKFLKFAWQYLLLLLTMLPRSNSRPHFLYVSPLGPSLQISQHPLTYSQTSYDYIPNAAPQPLFYRAVPDAPPANGPTRLFFTMFTRFPGPIETLVQRIQNYFSTYTVLQQPQPVLVQEIDIGPDMIPVDELDPENGSQPPSSPTIVAVEVPNPSWPDNNIGMGLPNNEIGQNTSFTNFQGELPNPSWPISSESFPTDNISSVISTSETSASESSASESPSSESPASENPSSEIPASENPASEKPASQSATLETAASETPAPETPAPETPEPETPVSATPASVNKQTGSLVRKEATILPTTQSAQ